LQIIRWKFIKKQNVLPARSASIAVVISSGLYPFQQSPACNSFHKDRTMFCVVAVSYQTQPSIALATVNVSFTNSFLQFISGLFG